MDKEPPLWFIYLASFATGAVGMLVARRRPILSALFVTVILLGAFALYLEWSDPFVRESIVKEAGITYLGGSVAALLAGIGLPLFGALAGSKKLRQSGPAWCWASGVSGGVLLGLTLFMCSGYVESLYYDYIFYPRVKAQDHYIMPLRWQDITAESLIACALVALLLLSAYLLRSAFRRQEKNENLVSSFHEKAGECQVFSFIVLFFSLSASFISSFSQLFPLSQAASVATLPSALFVERLSLGARWVYLIQ